MLNLNLYSLWWVALKAKFIIIWMVLKASIKKTSNLCRLLQSKNQFFILKIKPHWRNEWISVMLFLYNILELKYQNQKTCFGKILQLRCILLQKFFHSWSLVYTINIICEVLSNTVWLSEITNEDITSIAWKLIYALHFISFHLWCRNLTSYCISRCFSSTMKYVFVLD